MATAVKKPFEIRGVHVLIGVILFFGVITAVNVVMVTLAVKSFPGEEEKKSYMQGLQYNAVLEARAAQEALGWQAIMLDGSELPATSTTVRLRITDKTGRSVEGLTLSGVIGRPATDAEDQAVSLTPASGGTYIVNMDGLEAGVWDLNLTAEGPDGEKVEIGKRLWLK